MTSKENICKEYFNDCKLKELSKINYMTPQGHRVEAFICRKPNRYLGSLYITSVDGEETGQYVQGMPKIHYLDNYHMLKSSNGYMEVYEKLDGTNICLYGLKNKDGELLEVVPKTRNMGCLDPNFQNIYNQADTKIFTDWIKEHDNYSVFLELYGMGNPHMIKHMGVHIDTAFLGAFDGEDFVDDVIYFSMRKPRRFFKIYEMESQKGNYKGYYVDMTGLLIYYGAYLQGNEKNHSQYDTLDECVEYMKTVLEELNRKYQEENGRVAVEGAVINGLNTRTNKFTYIKVKPTTIETIHRSENGIPRQYIMKEIMKYLDEHGSTAKETWENNPSKVMKYINDNLAETYDQAFITKSQNKIKGLFEKKLYPLPTPTEIKEIGDKLIKENPNKNITDLMRLFGQQYPNMKKSGGKLYQYLESRL